MKIKYSVFVPVYNESKILEKNISLIYKEMKRFKSPFEIIIVDDNSNDQTQAIGKHLEKKQKQIRYVRFASGPSRRENLAKAMKMARGGILVYIDIDLAVNPKYLKNLIMDSYNWDIVIGSRYLKGSRVKRTFFRRFISNMYNNFMRFWLGSNIKDHQCGFKAFKKSVVFPIISEMGYDKKLTRGWFWDAELLIRAQRKGHSIKEIPVEWVRGNKSSFNIRRELRMVPYVIKLRGKLK